MNVRTVKSTVEFNLCSSCGMCKNACPKGCISWKRKNGLYWPEIDDSMCVQCGICVNICPGLGFSYSNDKAEPMKNMLGEYKAVYNAWSKNPELRHISASGGVVSSMIQQLLSCGKYELAFCVESYEYSSQLLTCAKYKSDFEEEWKKSSTPKSRYLPVSHENAVAYMKKHKDAKIILIGTSCAVRGFLNVIKQFNLNRENYLLIGLFCDKVFNYNVYSYFQDKFCEGRKLDSLHFKNKESGGWPGNMKFLFADGTYLYQDKSERAKAKEYFMPERCLYCMDKLNTCADISLGDNYTDKDSSELGSNSVIIRTERGIAAWNSIDDVIEYNEVPIEKIIDAQYLNGRVNNLYFGILKEQRIKKTFGADICLNRNIEIKENANDYERAWKRNLEMLHAGEVYHSNSQELEKQKNKSEKLKNPKSAAAICSRLYYAIKRRVK